MEHPEPLLWTVVHAVLGACVRCAVKVCVRTIMAWSSVLFSASLWLLASESSICTVRVVESQRRTVARWRSVRVRQHGWARGSNSLGLWLHESSEKCPLSLISCNIK